MWRVIYINYVKTFNQSECAAELGWHLTKKQHEENSVCLKAIFINPIIILPSVIEMPI